MKGIPRKMWAVILVLTLVSMVFSVFLQGDRTASNVSITTPSSFGTRGPGTQRVVLYERFTNTGCPPCSYATLNEEMLTDDLLPDKVAVLKYHVSWPSSTDPMYLFNPTEQMGRRNWYGDIGYVPYVKIDGLLEPNYPYTYKSLRDAVNTRLSIPSPISIGISGSLGASTGWANITIHAIDPPGQNLRLYVVLYENNIDYATPPGSSRETHFEFTVRDMIPNENGEAITLNQGDTIARSKTFTIDPIYDREQLGIVAIVQNSVTKEVVQASSYGFTDLSITSIDITPSSPSPVEGDVVTITALAHNNGEAISNAVVRFYRDSIGGLQIGSDRTTGPISSGGTATVQTAWDTTNLGGDHKIFVLLDANKDYWESDEYNNAAFVDIFVTPLNDVSAVDIPTFNERSLYPMGRYSVNGTVENTGFYSQGSFPVYFEVRTIGGFVEKTIYNQSFDGPTDEGWGQIPSAGSWQRGAPIGLNETVPSPPNCWGTDLMGIPPALSHDFLISPPLRLPQGSPSITLKFWQYTDFDTYWSKSQGRYIYSDSGYLWISEDFGISWDLIGSFWANESFTWVEHTFDLTSYGGKVVLYAFEIVADTGDWDPPTGEKGWYIDDVSVVAMISEETTVIGPLRADTSGTLDPMQTQSANFLSKLVPGGQVKLVLRTALATDTYSENDEFSMLVNVDPNHYIYSLMPGWNLISLPLIPTAGDPDSVFSSINGKWDVLRYYDVADTTDHWKEYSKIKDYNDMPSLTESMALWIHMKESAKLNLSGSIPSTTDIQLVRGWNFVGYPSLYDKELSSALNNPNIKKVEAFDPTALPTFLKQLTSGDLMLTGFGYWVYAKRVTTWTVSN